MANSPPPSSDYLRPTSHAHNWESYHDFEGVRYMITDAEGWGDILMTTSVIRELNYRGAEVFLVTRNWDDDSLWRHYPGVTGICREYKCGQGIGFINDADGARWHDSAHRHIHMFDSGGSPPACTNPNIYSGYTSRMLCAGIAAPMRPVRPLVYMTPESRLNAQKFLSRSGLEAGEFILFHPSSTEGSRCWDFMEQRDFCSLAKSHGVPIVQVARLNFGESFLHIPGVIHLPKEFNLLDSIALCDLAQSVVCVDSVMSHVSLATGTPSVCIYPKGINPNNRICGHHPMNISFQSDLHEPGWTDWRGISDISALDVWKALNELLRHRGESAVFSSPPRIVGDTRRV